jgi:ketosteroid isomerase-like protein
MQKFFETMFQTKPELTWAATKIEVARSGDLAYSWGAAKVSVKDKKGKATESTAKYVSVWKKQPDGSWKIAIDTMIPDPPAKKK